MKLCVFTKKDGMITIRRFCILLLAFLVLDLLQAINLVRIINSKSRRYERKRVEWLRGTRGR